MLLMWKLYTVSIVSLILLQYSVVLVDGVNNDENFYFANSNNKFLYKQKEDCENNFYFDFDYFQCRLCDLNFNLRPSGQRDECICSENSTEIITYDNILKRPVCEKDANASKKFKSLCSFYTVNATAFSTLRKAVRIYPKPQNQNCSCDEKLNENYHGEYCIKKELFKDYKNYENYEYLPLTKSLNLRYELKFVVFFCKVLHIRSQCNFLANLCVLTLFDIKKNGPCYPFFSQQNQQKGLFPDQNINEGNEYDGGEKIKPFLFFNNERSSERSSETLDLSFEALDQSNNTLNFTLVSYNLEGTLVEMRPFKLSDLNLCQLSPPVNIWQSKVQFGRNFFNKCAINLREIYKLGFLKTKFISIFLNFYKNQENILKNVPVLIRSPSTVNQNAETNEWQLIKRFFLIDTISGRQLKPDGKNSSTKVNNAPSESSFNKEFSQIIFAKNIELQFHIKENAEVETDRRNVIKMPTLIIEYGVLNITERSNRYKNSSSIDNVDDYLYNVETSFKITFIKRPNLNVFFQIILPILLSMSLICALFQTYFWKIRQQKIEYDLRTLMNFLINLLATISNSLFIFVALITSYILFLYKTQHKRIFLMLPLKKEEEIVGLLLSIALIFKIIKLMKIFCDIAGFDIFFIDFERPKYHAENIFNTSMPKSHPGTPSIASSIKPMISSPSQSNECVSAWRNYFIANEWQELMTKRKISIHLHVVFVITTLMLLGLENFSSTEFFLHYNQTHMQSYLNLYKADKDAENLSNNNVLLQVAVGTLIYIVIYLIQRILNFLIYERFIDNCIQQFIDVSSIANISVLILIDSYGYYIHGRSVHGRSDIDSFSITLQLKREEQNLCGQRGLLPGSDHQTYTIIAPKNLRLFYEKLISPLNATDIMTQQHDTNQFNQNFDKMIFTYHNINRFFAAFIDHGLKDVDYIVKEKNLFEKIFNCELYSNINDSKGVFYFDNGHSFDKVLFYGNETTIFSFELFLFAFLVFVSGNYLFSILSIGVITKLMSLIIHHVTKKNLARKTLIDKRFLI